MVSTRRSKKRAKKPGRPRNLGPLSPKPVAEAPNSPASLPLPGRGDETPSAPTTALELSTPCPRCGAKHSAAATECGLCGLNLQQSVVPEKKPHWWRPADSEIRKKAIKIVLMRSSGMEDAEIAAALGIGLRTVSNYVQVAGKNGWLESDLVADPKERLEYDLMHKVVRNMAESLDSYNPVTRHEAAMEIAKGTLFKKFAEAGPAVQNTNVLKIQIIQAPGPPIQIREETTGGMPAYVEGEVVGESK